MCFSWANWYDIMAFILWPVNVVDYSAWFLNIELLLHTRKKLYLAVVSYSFYLLLDLIS